jgi:methionyl aminopeptidase
MDGWYHRRMTIKTAEDIESMRQGGRILARVLELLRKEAQPGTTPRDMAFLAKKELQRLGGKPAFLGVPGPPPYPDIICISVNDAVQHSIPDDRPFEAGDVVNFDFGVTYNRMVTDGGITVCIGGSPDPDSARLITGTEEALKNALTVVHDGCHVGDISAVIGQTLNQYSLGIVRELTGHGVGYQLHEDGPDIFNYGKPGTGPILKTGMTVAIEPIATLGSPKIYQDNDGWTLKTQDGSLAAQFEHTVLVTKSGCEILTQA